MSRSILAWFRFSSTRAASRPATRRRPVFDTLEDRCVPTVYTVDLVTDEDDGNTAAGDVCLREAIKLANQNSGADTVQFAFTSQTSLPISLGAISITDDTTITGPGSGTLTLQGSSSSRVFTIDDSNSAVNKSVNISGLTITGSGSSSLSGGAISNAESLSIDSCVITACAGNLGGGVFQDGVATLTVKNSLFSSNTAVTGGGIQSQSTSASAVAIDLSTFSGNTATGIGGGALAVDNGGLSLDRSTVSGNAATGNNGGNGLGGGVNVDNGATATITSSTFSGNSTGIRGGGLFARSSNVTVVNSTFSGNTAQENGGGIHNNGTLTLINCTLTLNGAGSLNNNNGTGGGIFARNDVSVSTTLFNTIIAGNFHDAAVITDSSITGDDYDGNPATANSSNNLISEPPRAGLTESGLTDGVNGNIVGQGGNTISITTILDIDLLPGPTFQLGAEQGLNANGGPTKTHALVQNSLAIGAASASVPGYSSYDQRDAFRDPTSPDIGAYEVQHPLAPVGAPSTYAKTFQPKPSTTANEAFVKGLYQSTLLRAPDAGGLSGWVAALNGGANKTGVAFGFVNSVENRTNQVTFFYKYFLGRNPDPGGLAGWVNVLQSGADEGTVMSGFLLSTEFTGQNDNASFVNLMYYALLGRQADSGGFNGWVASLNSGQLTREQVGNGFLRSTESITRVVVADFGSYLKRTITPSAASPYVAQISSGTTFGRVAANVLGSDEFYVAAGQNL